VKGSRYGSVLAGQSMMCRSEWHTPAPATLIKIWPGPGFGTGNSLICGGICQATNRTALS